MDISFQKAGSVLVVVQMAHFTERKPDKPNHFAGLEVLK